MTGALASRAPEPRVTVVVPAFNALGFLRQTIPALADAIRRHGDAELVVADNGSADDTIAWLAQHARTSRVLRMPGVTISALRNAGARAGTGTLIAFVDADCLVPDDYLVSADAAMQDPAIAACGSRYLLPDSPHWVERVWQNLHEQPGQSNVIYLPAGNFVVRRTAFESVGGFREDLVTGEDADLGLRMTERGLITRSTPTVWVRHLGNPKSISAFYRKQRWHALGMFGTVRRNRIDRPVAMTLAHLLLLVSAVLGAIALPAGRILALILPWLVPVVTVVFRWWHGGLVRGAFLRAVLLYQAYYLARIAALFRIILSRGRASA